MRRIMIAAALLGALVTPAAARAQTSPAGKRFVKECSACHMAYPPQFLPARSWRKLMGNLTHHFGEDASLGRKTRTEILGYLVANAADSANGDPRLLEGLKPGQTPLRITDMPFWQAIHPQLLRPGVGMGPGIRSASNCAKCHSAGGGEGNEGGGESNERGQ